MNRTAWWMLLVTVVAGASCTQEGSDESSTEVPGPIAAFAVVGPSGGSLEYHNVTLVVPEGALAEPVTITLREVTDPPRGAVGPAWEFGPDGLAFSAPATLKIFYDSDALPPGTDPRSLRLSVWEGGRWRGLDDHVNRRVERRVVGSIHHFSTYGIVADPREVAGTGTRWEANGVVAESSSEAWGRLYVSPTAISMFIESAAAGIVQATLSGLPTDEANHLYVDGYETHLIVEPSAGGVATVDVEGARPHFLWVQPDPGTTHIGGPGDECALVGVRTGDLCTLTTDLLEAVSIDAPNQVLDCAGHRIAQPKPGAGIGILISAFQTPKANVTIRNCVIGQPGFGFFQGINVAGADAVEVSDSVLLGNQIGIYLQAAGHARVLRNQFMGDGNVGLQVYEGSSDGEVADNQAALVGGISPTAIALKGGKPGPVANPSSRNTVHRNHVVGGDVGIALLANAVDNAVTENEVEGATRAVWIGVDGWPNRVWWNNFHDWTTWGVWADIDAAEISDANRGNWWGHNCPDPGFVPSVDSNSSYVEDSFAYGARDAWLRGEPPGCAGAGGTPICPEDANAGAATAWDNYEPRSAAVQGAWERLRERITVNETAALAVERNEWAVRGVLLKEKAPRPPIVLWNQNTDNPAFIAGRMTSPSNASPHAIAQRFLHDNADLLGSTTGRALPDLNLESTSEDALGTRFVFRQNYRGIPIEAAESIVIVDKDGAVRLYKGQYFPRPVASIDRSCTARRARELAVAELSRRWPDAVSITVDAELRLLADSSGALRPIWRGAVGDDADPYADERAAAFVVDVRSCTLQRFGLDDDEGGLRLSGGRGRGGVQEPNVSFVRFGGQVPGDVPTTRRAFHNFQLGPTSGDWPPQLLSDAGSVQDTRNDRGRGAGEPVGVHGVCPADPWHPEDRGLPCYNYPQQVVRDSFPAGCYDGTDGSPDNPDAERCDEHYSSSACVTAFWRLQQNTQRLSDLQFGWTRSYWPSTGWLRGLGDNFSLICQADIHPSRYRVRDFWYWSERDKLILETGNFAAESDNDLADFRVLDHEFGHHIQRYLMASHSPNGSHCCNIHQGQSFTIQEVFADYYADVRTGLPSGTYWEWLGQDCAGYYGDPAVSPTLGSYPSYDLERRDCRTAMPNAGGVHAGAPCIPGAVGSYGDCARGVGSPRLVCHPLPGYGSMGGVCRSPCLYVAPEAVVWDSYAFYAADERDDPMAWEEHAPGNGRVLYQALVDYHERFGSVAFSHAGYRYGGPDSSNRTMFQADVLERTPYGNTRARVRDWGVSHDVADAVGTLEDWRALGLCYATVQSLEIPEAGADRMLVAFRDISLPEGGALIVQGVNSVTGELGPEVRYDGPFEWNDSGGGWLFSEMVSFDTITVAAVDPGCRHEVMFHVRSWRHMGGTIPERLVLASLRRARARDVWVDFFTNILEADLELYSPAQQHLGEFFLSAFASHGIDSHLYEFCDGRTGGGEGYCMCRADDSCL